jgi:hypothetical protein
MTDSSNHFRDVGADRLLQLADILDKAEPQNYSVMNARMEGYNQNKWTHSCGTPACALGHWAMANTDRWCRDEDGGVSLHQFSGRTSRSAREEFGISAHEFVELFSSLGCGQADHNPQKAAAYIRAFVERKMMCPT